MRSPLTTMVQSHFRATTAFFCVFMAVCPSLTCRSELSAPCAPLLFCAASGLARSARKPHDQCRFRNCAVEFCDHWLFFCYYELYAVHNACVGSRFQTPFSRFLPSAVPITQKKRLSTVGCGCGCDYYTLTPPRTYSSRVRY